MCRKGEQYIVVGVVEVWGLRCYRVWDVQLSTNLLLPTLGLPETLRTVELTMMPETELSSLQPLCSCTHLILKFW
jgi:hypothetical protein